MSIIFLDFDGPLFPEKVHLYAQNKGELAKEKCAELDLHPFIHYWFADPFAIAILNELRAVAPYQIVISSSWADDHLNTKEQIEALFKANGLGYNLHPDWRTPRNPEHPRHIEIEGWLSLHPEVQHYLILDDAISAPALSLNDTYQTAKVLQQSVYLAHEYDGFSYAQFEQMRLAMSQWPEAYPLPSKTSSRKV